MEREKVQRWQWHDGSWCVNVAIEDRDYFLDRLRRSPLFVFASDYDQLLTALGASERTVAAKCDLDKERVAALNQASATVRDLKAKLAAAERVVESAKDLLDKVAIALGGTDGMQVDRVASDLRARCEALSEALNEIANVNSSLDWGTQVYCMKTRANQALTPPTPTKENDT